MDDIKISVVIPVYNASATLMPCLEAIYSSSCIPFEVIAVDDCSSDNSIELASAYTDKIIELEGGPFGPAYARNRGVNKAQGDIVLFIDCDVVVHPDTIQKVKQTFDSDPEMDATFGSYDDTPSEGEFLSQYKNLIHHFVHQGAQEDGGTFWAGCGAIKRGVFLDMGGFDEERYARPSIEDIELGYRLNASGSKIYVNKAVQVKHLKRWSLSSWLKTDIFSRAIPWTALIFQARDLPDDLNLGISQRYSAFLLIVWMLAVLLTFDFNLMLLLPLFWFLCLLVLSKCNPQNGVQFFHINRVEGVMIGLIFLGLFGVAYYLNEYSFLLLLSWVFITTLAGVLVPSGSTGYKSVLFALIVVGFFLGFGALLAGSSIWLAVFSLILLLIILVLNKQLFGFFTRKRGLFFAAAAIPFQLTYYIYSMAAFLVGGGVYLWNTQLNKHKLNEDKK